jgi:transporter family-2 protein
VRDNGSERIVVDASTALADRPPRSLVHGSALGFALPSLLAATAGAGISLQAFLNGRLATQLGSPLLAASVSSLSALGVLLALGIATGALARAVARMRAGSRPRPWHVLCGTLGGAYLLISTTAAPRIGIALLAVAAICGQSVSSLLLDRSALAPTGRVPLTTSRVAGVALAVVAVAFAADLGSASARSHAALIAAALVAGVAIAFQQVGLGHVSLRTGESLAAAASTVAMSAVVILPSALIATRGVASSGWSAPPLDWLGGLVGAAIATGTAKAVRTIGVVPVMLALVAGQTIGALGIDLVAPVPGHPVTVARMIGVVLVLVAVVLGSRRPAA